MGKKQLIGKLLELLLARKEGLKSAKKAEDKFPKEKPSATKSCKDSQKKAEQLKKNKAQGKKRELEVKKELEAEGHEVLGSEVTIKTPKTNRRVDHLIRDGETGKIRAIEVKSGNAERNRTQIKKDNVMESEGGKIIGKNAPDELKGMTIKIPTKVLH